MKVIAKGPRTKPAAPGNHGGTPSGRLGTQLRGKLQKDYSARGKALYSLWYAYSPKAQADVVLHGDQQYYHFLLVESDPEVTSANYDVQNQATRMVGEELGQLVSAELLMANGSIVWRCVRSEPSELLDTKLSNLQTLIRQRGNRGLPTTVELLTAEDLTANPLRIQNWNRLLPYLAQARALPLHEFSNEVATLVHTRDEVTAYDVVGLAKPGHEALYIAALLKGVQYGKFRSDLNEKPWSWVSRFWSNRK